jgi:hypothetical protein
MKYQERDIMSVIDTINRGLSESQQNVIDLTEPDFDVYPLPVQMDTEIKLQIDLDIESQGMAGDILVWGHPTYGLWGVGKWGAAPQVGFILGHPKYGVLGTSQLGSNASSWVKEQEFENI